MAERILVVDDEAHLLGLLQQAFEAQGYQVSTALDGETALALAAETPPDLVLLDLIMPGIGGLEVCRALRADARLRDVPLIMLTALQETRAKVQGLDIGADDYVTKPFDLPELLARVRARLRAAQGDVLTVANCRLVRTRQELQRGGQVMALTRREFALLQLFFRHPNRLLPRATVAAEVWGDKWQEDSNVLDVYVRRLRRKLADLGPNLRICTARGDGYLLDAPAD